MWVGRLESQFTLDGAAVRVSTVVDPHDDIVSVQIVTGLLAGGSPSGGLVASVAFPYGTEAMNSNGADWSRPADHTSVLTPVLAARAWVAAARIARTLDGDRYTVSISTDSLGSAAASIEPESRPHLFIIRPAPGSTVLSFSVRFSTGANATAAVPAGFDATAAAAAVAWPAFWASGAAIDFAGSTAPRAAELESKVVMSQWVERVQEAGPELPAETGLTTNSWYGKFHGEMRLWHQAHHAAWGRPGLFEPSTEYYLGRVLGEAKRYAATQGYPGARWFKMRSNVAESPVLYTGPSPVGPLLLQQQPHPIVYAELLYRAAAATGSSEAAQTLRKYDALVAETADFMAGFALQAAGSDTRGCLNLGPPMAPGMGVEGSDPGNEYKWNHTANGCYELTYWRFGLEMAQRWRARLGRSREPRWQAVLDTLCRPKVRQWNGTGVYFFDDFSSALIGPSTCLGQLYACGHVPCLDHGIDHEVMRATLRLATADFNFSLAYPGDDTVYAMAAARLGDFGAAIELLTRGTDTATNRYNRNNGHWQGYFPALTSTNGQLLYAVAMLAGGWTGSPNRTAPGFPISGGWVVKAEGFPGLL